MPDLGEDAATSVMDGSGDGFPCLGLFFGPDAWDLRVADAEGIDGGAFGKNESGGGALGVVLGLNGRGDVVDGAAQAGEGCHEDAVGEMKVAELEGVEKVRHHRC